MARERERERERETEGGGGRRRGRAMGKAVGIAVTYNGAMRRGGDGHTELKANTGMSVERYSCCR
jgi:hypothetical protein